MGFFEKLISKFIASTVASNRQKIESNSRSRIEVRYTEPDSSAVHVSEIEVANRTQAYAFIYITDPPTLKTADQWWNEDTYKRRRREGSEKAYAWLLPFIPLTIIKSVHLRATLELGLPDIGAMAKGLRTIIREYRKAKEPYAELLLALYGACVAADFSESLRFEGSHVVRYVDINDVQQIKIEYATMGYQCINSLSKTDVKWLIETFGEPAEHQTFEALWPQIRRNAVARYCWSELRGRNDSAKSLGLAQQSIQDWLNELAKRNIGYHKEWQDRVAARNEYVSELGAAQNAAWAATRQTFVVADIETTGLDAERDEILEFAAVRVERGGSVTKEFSIMVHASKSVPAEITRLTGITQAAIDVEGRPLSEALEAFVEFVENHPVFFHNAPFDLRFIKKASSSTKIKFANSVYDTLPLARQAWPTLGTYKLTALSEHVGTTVPKHRALSDTKAALAVLLAARSEVDANASQTLKK
jgi:DNA polymerase III epsilon subunit-like protein